MSQMVEVNVAELEGDALDWAVGLGMGWEYRKCRNLTCMGWYDGKRENFQCISWRPSTDWSQGGPLIYKYMRESGAFCDGLWQHTGTFKCSFEDGGSVSEGETPLIAACRAIVTAKLGDVISIPAELVTP